MTALAIVDQPEYQSGKQPGEKHENRGFRVVKAQSLPDDREADRYQEYPQLVRETPAIATA
jgi:hypothetical protein